MDKTVEHALNIIERLKDTMSKDEKAEFEQKIVETNLKALITSILDNKNVGPIPGPNPEHTKTNEINNDSDFNFLITFINKNTHNSKIKGKLLEIYKILNPKEEAVKRTS